MREPIRYQRRILGVCPRSLAPRVLSFDVALPPRLRAPSFSFFPRSVSQELACIVVMPRDTVTTAPGGGARRCYLHAPDPHRLHLPMRHLNLHPRSPPLPVPESIFATARPRFDPAGRPLSSLAGACFNLGGGPKETSLPAQVLRKLAGCVLYFEAAASRTRTKAMLTIVLLAAAAVQAQQPAADSQALPL